MKLKKVLVIGEVLYDHFPHGKVLGGAPFNFAYHLHNLGVNHPQKLGVEVNFISSVGDDEEGRSILEFAKQTGFAVDGIQVNDQYPTGMVSVALDSKGDHTFDIVADCAYDFIELNTEYMAKDDVSLIYLGTLAQRNKVSRDTLIELARSYQGKAVVFVDLNLRAPFFNKQIIEETLKMSTHLKISEEEEQELTKIFGPSQNDKNFINYLMGQFDIENVCVTRGSKGSEIHQKGSSDVVRKPVASLPGDYVDSVGAGDAFSAMLAYGIISGWSMDDRLEKASAFAAKICCIRGALPSN